MSKKSGKKKNKKEIEETPKRESYNIKGLVGFVLSFLTLCVLVVMFAFSCYFYIQLAGETITAADIQTLEETYTSMAGFEILTAPISLISLICGIAGWRQVKTWRFYKLSIAAICISVLCIFIAAFDLFTLSGSSIFFSDLTQTTLGYRVNPVFG